jgi:hypothetical protein
MRQPVAPYIFGNPGEFSLGNLLDEAHGAIYTIAGRTLAAYPFAVDEARHAAVHRTADLTRALAIHDRADALQRAALLEEARREAGIALEVLSGLSARPGLPPADRVLARRTQGDTHAMLSVLSADGGPHRMAAAAAYTDALELLLAMSSLASPESLAGLRADIEERRARLYPPPESAS